MSLTIAIELRPNRSGQQRAYIAGTRVRVQDIYALAEVQGRSPDEIVEALPHLSLRRFMLPSLTISIIVPRSFRSCARTSKP